MYTVSRRRLCLCRETGGPSPSWVVAHRASRAGGSAALVLPLWSLWKVGGDLPVKEGNERSKCFWIDALCYAAASDSRPGPGFWITDDRNSGGWENRAPLSAAPWYVSTVDQGMGIGSHVSVAIDDSDTTYISYYDSANKDLKMAKYVGSGGNCGPDNDWSCETVDSSGDMGQYSSIAIDPTTNLPVIAYWTGAPMISSWQLRGGGGWDIIIVDSVARRIHIAKDRLDRSRTYRLLSCGGIDESRVCEACRWRTGNCGGNNYQCDTIDGGAGIGTVPFPGPGRVRSTSDSLLRRGQRRSLVCPAWHSWQLWPWRHLGLLPGEFRLGCRSICFTGRGQRQLSHIAYYDATNGKLMYAVQVGSGGNCGFSELVAM